VLAQQEDPEAVGDLRQDDAGVGVEQALPSLLREVVTLAGIHAIGNVTPAADFNAWADPEAGAAALIRARIEAYGDRADLAAVRAAPVHNAFAVASLVEPRLVARRHLHVDVETKGELTTGRTVIDFEARGAGVPNVEVALPDEPWRFAEVLLGSLLGQPASAVE